MGSFPGRFMGGAGLLCIFLIAPAVSGFERRAVDWGPLFNRTLYEDGAIRTRALGPFFEKVDHPEGYDFYAVRPLFSRLDEPDMDRTRREYVWPLASSRRLGTDSAWRVLIAYGAKDSANPNKPYRIWILPFYFQGRTKAGDPYFALWPLGGTIRDFMYRDKINFVLWPIYTRTQVNALDSVSVVWPIYNKTTGGKVHRERVFPFYGVSSRDGMYTKKFVCWPFWTSTQYHDPRYAGGGWILFPITGRVKTVSQDSLMFIPPLIRIDRSDDLRRIHAPWPLVQVSSGETKRRYFWPFYGRRQIGHTKTGFFLWPLMRFEDTKRTTTHYGGYRFFPFVHDWQTRTLNNEGEPDAVLTRKLKVWPFYSYQKEGDESMLRILELNPFRHYDAMERNWSPFWTVYSRLERGEDRETEILWGMYRHRRIGACYRRVSLFPLFEYERDEREDDTRSWSLLKGLVGWERKGENRGLRLLYVLRFGDRTREMKP